MLALEAPKKGYVKEVINGKYELSKSGTLVHKRTRKVVKGHLTKGGYVLDSFWVDGKIIAKYRHQLVYETFIGEIPEGMQVNHKDENKQNNVISNIDTLMTPKENSNWGTRNERIASKNDKFKSKPVIQKTLQGEVIKIWPSASEIQRQLGYSFGNICNCCIGGYFDNSRGKWHSCNTAYGYKWEYAEE